MLPQVVLCICVALRGSNSLIEGARVIRLAGTDLVNPWETGVMMEFYNRCRAGVIKRLVRAYITSLISQKL